MNRTSQKIALALGAVFLFTAGIYAGIRMGGKEAHESPPTAASGTSHLVHADATHANQRDKSPSVSPGLTKPQQLILEGLREAMLLPAESRTMPLLKALEETTKLPLHKDLLTELQRIVDEGEIESSHYLLSLMEQREEKVSVDFLLQAAAHRDANISDRALFALGAVAGTVFKNTQEASAWAANWQPDAGRAGLFAPQTAEKNPEPLAADTRLPGPRAREPKQSAPAAK
jgi:hypothetical protein